jgi:hypothetical protein
MGFSSKLLIAQVLGRGLRVPPGLPLEALVTVNNHEAWSDEIGNLLKEVLEVENTLSWGYDQRRKDYVFPLYNLSYEAVQKTVETKRERRVIQKSLFFRKTGRRPSILPSPRLACWRWRLNIVIRWRSTMP